MRTQPPQRSITRRTFCGHNGEEFRGNNATLTAAIRMAQGDGDSPTATRELGSSPSRVSGEDANHFGGTIAI